jgi:hypothetical protein
LNFGVKRDKRDSALVLAQSIDLCNTPQFGALVPRFAISA